MSLFNTGICGKNVFCLGKSVLTTPKISKKENTAVHVCVCVCHTKKGKYGKIA